MWMACLPGTNNASDTAVAAQAAAAAAAAQTPSNAIAIASAEQIATVCEALEEAGRRLGGLLPLTICD